MSIEFQITNKVIDAKGGVTAASFKAIKASDNGDCKTYGDCSLTLNYKSKSFIPIQKVTDQIVTGWIMSELGNERLAALESILSARIKKDAKVSKKAKS